MIHNAIRIGSKIYHQNEPDARYYDQYMATRKPAYPEETLSVEDAEQVKRFLNQWRTRYQSTPEELKKALNDMRDDCLILADLDFLSVNFSHSLSGRTVSEIMESIFKKVATCGKRYEVTGTSKILHVLLPNIFLMWDESISRGYSVRREAAGYAHAFLPRVQLVARRAIREMELVYGLSQENAIELLCPCGHGLVKVLDEYNYAKYTIGSDSVWKAEYVLGMTPEGEVQFDLPVGC